MRVGFRPADLARNGCVTLRVSALPAAQSIDFRLADHVPAGLVPDPCAEDRPPPWELGLAPPPTHHETTAEERLPAIEFALPGATARAAPIDGDPIRPRHRRRPRVEHRGT